MEHWYALYTRPRHEKKVYDLLLEKKQEVFLPLIKKTRKWKDRKKVIEIPLFSSYLFARFEYKFRFDLLHTPGVVKIVNFKGEPAVVPDWQIESIKKMLDNPDRMRLENYMRIGEEVEVMDGAFKGMRGAIKIIKGDQRLVVTIEGVMQSLSVDIDPDFVKKINGSD